eukprot:scaffold20985_cov221-Amphora_coffeaeformis.AAC.3
METLAKPLTAPKLVQILIFSEFNLFFIKNCYCKVEGFDVQGYVVQHCELEDERMSGRLVVRRRMSKRGSTKGACVS